MATKRKQQRLSLRMTPRTALDPSFKIGAILDLGSVKDILLFRIYGRKPHSVCVKIAPEIFVETHPQCPTVCPPRPEK